MTRTQAERRASTQAKLLDATVEALVGVGYAGTSTTEICRRAGVSQGALFRYWPTKGELLADAAAHLLGRVTTAYEQAFAGRGGVGAREALEALWETYRQPDLQAAVELYVAARTDQELATALARIEPAHRANLQRIATQVMDPALVALPGFAPFVELALAAVQGASIGAAVVDTSHDVILDALERLVEPRK
ncbi:MAG: TetR family transcriptional regulator [Frankiales bacterium]|nr:TetR family transcriptional regulator [Frankiales bacterium]